AMATADGTSRFANAPGLPADYYRVIPLGHRIFGVFLVVATILGHGALLTSTGLALAVWIKRPNRANRLGIGLFILVAAAWPIFAGMVFSGRGFRTEGALMLSPIVVCPLFLRFFTMRVYAFNQGILWWGAFWAVEVLVVALGLLWLTVHTFD